MPPFSWPACPPPLFLTRPRTHPNTTQHNANQSKGGGHPGAWIFGSLLLLVLCAAGLAYGFYVRNGHSFPAWGGASYRSIPTGGATQPAYQAATTAGASGASSGQPPRR